jgi:hypothetical protein
VPVESAFPRTTSYTKKMFWAIYMKEKAVKFILLRITLTRPRKDIEKWW